MTAVTTSRVGKGTESPNRLSGGRGGVEARGAEEELLEPRGMTSSSARGSQGLKIRALAGPRALTRRVRRGAAPRLPLRLRNGANQGDPGSLKPGDKPSGHLKAPFCRCLA